MAEFHVNYAWVIYELNGGQPISAAQAKLLRTAAKNYGFARRNDLVLAKAGPPGEFAVGEKQEGAMRATRQVGLSHEQWLGYADRSVRFEERCDAALKALGVITEPLSPKERADLAWRSVLDASSPVASSPSPPGPANGVQDAPGSTISPATDPESAA
jgi:hypothetical protein